MNVVNHTHLFHIINVSSIAWHFNGKRTQIQIEATFLKLLWTDLISLQLWFTIVVIIIIFFAFISSNYRFYNSRVCKIMTNFRSHQLIQLLTLSTSYDVKLKSLYSYAYYIPLLDVNNKISNNFHKSLYSCFVHEHFWFQVFSRVNIEQHVFRFKFFVYFHVKCKLFRLNHCILYLINNLLFGLT